jgi:hypothetical protein
MSGWDARRTYLYLTSLVTLVIAIFGFVGLAKDVVAFAVPEPSYYARPEPWMRTPADTLYTKAEIDSMAAVAKRTEDARQRYHRLMETAQHLAMLVISLPLFVWHIRQAQKAEVR